VSDTLQERLDAVVREHWREINMKKPDTKKVAELAAAAKSLRAALKKVAA